MAGARLNLAPTFWQQGKDFLKISIALEAQLFSKMVLVMAVTEFLGRLAGKSSAELALIPSALDTSSAIISAIGFLGLMWALHDVVPTEKNIERLSR